VNDYAFGNFLYNLRAEKGLSQAQLGEMLGVTNKAVSKWENGSAKPNTSLLPKIAEILGVTVEELFACKRIEKDDEYGKIKNYLLFQRKKYAILSSFFLSLIVILPLFLIEFICVVLGFGLPDDVIGPIGSISIMLVFIISVTAFIIYRNNFKRSIIPTEMEYNPGFVRRLSIGTLFSAIATLGILLLTIGVYILMNLLISNHLIANIYLSITAFIFIISLGVYICFGNTMRLLSPSKRIEKNIPFSQQPKLMQIIYILYLLIMALVIFLRIYGILSEI